METVDERSKRVSVMIPAPLAKTCARIRVLEKDYGHVAAVCVETKSGIKGNFPVLASVASDQVLAAVAASLLYAIAYDPRRDSVGD